MAGLFVLLTLPKEKYLEMLVGLSREKQVYISWNTVLFMEKTCIGPAKKIAAAPEKFRTFLAINQGRVIGYLNVTHCFEENEPYDIYVLPEYRRKGYGRKLLAKALDCNQPRGMMLLVETDNTAAIRLYELMNFKTVPGQNSLTAHWQIPEEKEIDFEKEMRYS